MDEVAKALGIDTNGVKYEDMNPVEKETFHTWLENIKTNELTLEKIREYVASMRDSIELDLTRVDLDHKNDTYLKARLRNYMLLEAFLSGPEKAKRAVERSIKNLKR